MNAEIEGVPIRCAGCAFISPYLDDIQRLQNRQVTPEIRARLMEWGFSRQDIDATANEKRAELEQSRRALSKIAVRTVDCPGARLITLDPEKQSNEGVEIICMSPHDSDQ
jgi:hypothetical protein